MKFKNMILFVTLLSSSIFSQSYYLRLGGGYGIGTSTNTIVETSSMPVTGTNGNVDIYTTEKAKSYSFGQGIYLGGSIGYMYSKSLGIDIELQYLKGSTVTNSGENKVTDAYITNYNDENSGESFMITPSLIIKTELEFMNPYFKAGPIFSFSSITEKNTYIMPSGLSKIPVTYYDEFLLNGGMAIGFNAAIGASKEIRKNTEIFIEISSRNISYAPSKGERIKSTRDNTNMLLAMPLYYKQTNYEETIVTRATSAPDYNQPNVQPKNDYPFSSLTFSLGVSYSF